MRIALLTPEHPGCGPSYGVGAYVATQAAILAGAGHEVIVVAATAEGGRIILRTGDEPLPAPHVPALLRPLAYRAGLMAALRRWAPDVIETPNWGGLDALLGHRWPRVVRLSTPARAIRAADPLRALARWGHHGWERASVRGADAVIANSHAMAAMSARLYGRGADAVIDHPWDGPIATPRSDGDEVVAVGRLEHRKGTDVLLAAWPRVREAVPTAKLHLVGDDQGGFAAGAGPGVVVHGRLSDADLASLRARCRVQAIPSRFESFGLVALEAWASGLAVVAARCGGLAEVVDGAGLLVEVGDAAGLAEALIRTLRERSLGLHLTEAGQRRLGERFAPEAWLRGTLAAYERARERWRLR